MGTGIDYECAPLEISVNNVFFSAHAREERRVLLHPCMIVIYLIDAILPACDSIAS